MIMCCENGKLTDLCMEKDFKVIGLKQKESEIFELCRAQLDEYFAGSRREFTVPLDLRGTPFKQRVWRELESIPYGETLSYSDVAVRIGNPPARQAVGRACKDNPVIIIVPCHRVLGAYGNLTGYAGGLEMKQYLLELEEKYSK